LVSNEHCWIQHITRENGEREHKFSSAVTSVVNGEIQADRGLVAEALELILQGVFMGLNWLQCLKEPLRLLSSSQTR
jgi:hypothetical protein